MKPLKSFIMLGISCVFIAAIIILFIHLVIIGVVVGVVLFCFGWLANKFRAQKQPNDVHIRHDL